MSAREVLGVRCAGYEFVMEPESRRLMRAWRDEDGANQVLEAEVLAFGQEENNHSLYFRVSTEFILRRK